MFASCIDRSFHLSPIASRLTHDGNVSSIVLPWVTDANRAVKRLPRLKCAGQTSFHPVNVDVPVAVASFASHMKQSRKKSDFQIYTFALCS